MRRKLSPTSPWYKALSLLASLKLCVACLAISMVLVLLNTLAQVQLGIYEAQARYFATWFVWTDAAKTGIALPFIPGGYLVGGVLIINLLCAHWKRFSLKWSKFGLLMIHLGILILLGGGFVTHWLSHEGQLIFDEGETKHFYESFVDRELVIYENLPRNEVRETVFPVGVLDAGETLMAANLPFELRIVDYYKNTRLTLKRAMGGSADAKVDRGWGQRVEAEPVRETFKPNEQNLITAIIQPVWNGEVVGTWLATNAVTDPQWFELEGRTFGVSLRKTRYYMPFALTLKDFSHDRYPGTDIPKNFSSLVQLQHPVLKEDREILIYMNHPLRYQGKTFFQAGFDNQDTTSIFQVVENPGWLLPYVSCILVSLGLFWHFTLHLVRHVNKRRST
jgi:hypothetical protein